MENYDAMFDYLGEIFAVEKSESNELDTQEKKRAAKKVIREKDIYKVTVAKWDQKLEKERDVWVTKDKSATSKIKLAVGPSYKSQIESQKLSTAYGIWNFLKEEGAKSYGGARFAAYFDFISLGYGDELLSDYLTKKQLLYEKMRQLDVILTEDIAFIDIVARLPVRFTMLKQECCFITRGQKISNLLICLEYINYEYTN